MNEPYDAVLSAAVTFTGEAVIAEFLAHGVDVNAISPASGCSVLHGAVASNRRAVAMQLLASGAWVDARDTDGYTPLHVAVEAADEGIVRVLLAAGADVHAASFQRQNPLHVATQHDQTELVVELMERGADTDVNAGDIEGRAPLHHTASIRIMHCETAKMLDHGADVKVSRSASLTPLHDTAA